jgi:hypothetical protein
MKEEWRMGDVWSRGSSEGWCIGRRSWGWVLEGSVKGGCEIGLGVNRYREGEEAIE